MSLSVGFLIDEANVLPAWEYDMLQELLKASFISKVVLIRAIHSSSEIKSSRHESFAFGLFKYFENAWFKRLPDASAMIDLSSLESTFNKLHIFQKPIDPNSIPEELDLLYVSFQLENISFARVPRFGIWQMQFGDDQQFKNELPAFWEVMDNETITRAQLKVTLDDELEKVIVYNAISATVPFSVKNNFNTIAWKASHFLSDRLRELCLIGPSRFFGKSKKVIFEAENSKKKVRFQNPPNTQMLWMFIRNCFRYLIYKIKQRVDQNQFILLFARGKLEIDKIDIDKYIKLIPPHKNFWADPFVIEKENEHFIFFEEGAYPEYKGRLAAMRINPDGTCGQHQIILEKPYHMSYPFVFENNGKFYMIPETSANRTVELYYCKNFPFEWEFSRYLMKDVIFQDPTLFFYNNIWWLFVTTVTPKSGTSNDQLMIYYSPDVFFGEWTPHAGNPVITDISNCRPAGKIFINDNRIFRPAQNNASNQYGYSIRINEIELLSPFEYKEKMIAEISPDNHRQLLAVHTLNASNNMIVIDGIMR